MCVRACVRVCVRACVYLKFFTNYGATLKKYDIKMLWYDVCACEWYKKKEENPNRCVCVRARVCACVCVFKVFLRI